MIILLGGTADANRLIRRLWAEGIPVTACVVGEYAARLAAEAGAERVLAGARGAAELADLTRGALALVDATHPFAQQASRTARQAAEQAGVPLLRLARAPAKLPQHPRLFPAVDWAGAAEQAGALGEVIFLTVGSRHLEELACSPALAGKRLVARVLPQEESLAACRAAGLEPRQVVAMQGPFSVELNREMLRHFGAQVLVTKDAGAEGGTREKVEAALAEGLAVVMVQRPPEEVAGFTEAELVARLCHLSGLPERGSK